MTRTTFHLVPTAVWRSSDPGKPYRTPSLDVEGFIHCTDGADEVLRTGTRHFRGDPRDYFALTIDLDRTGSPWRFDDPAGIYPHVYGTIDRGAIIVVAPVRRDGDGTFLEIGPPVDQAP